MLKYFLKPLNFLDVIVIVLILIWFLLFVLNKYKRFQICTFLASHYAFYLSKIILNDGNAFVPSAIVLLVSSVVLIICWLKKSKIGEVSSKIKWIYCSLTIALIIFVVFYCILIKASSILMPPPHWCINASLSTVEKTEDRGRFCVFYKKWCLHRWCKWCICRKRQKWCCSL